MRTLMTTVSPLMSILCELMIFPEVGLISESSQLVELKNTLMRMFYRLHSYERRDRSVADLPGTLTEGT